MELDQESIYPLRSDRETILLRARLLADAGSVLILGTAPGAPAAPVQQKLQREYALAGRLSPDWAAVPLRLEKLDGRPALILADPGGDPLNPAANGPLPLARFLHIAVQAAVALRHVHGCGLVHKDIRPGNMLVDPAGAVHLTGFGLASDLPRERQQLSSLTLLDGTFAYMAPEQTGRMNRSVDARSDLYALGVSFYELLSATLPFTAQDPAEWIHCHVARLPEPLLERARGIPEPVCDIIMKLLAKAPEERYQTAGGLEADLRQCLERLGRGAPLAAFPLGQADVPDRLLVPERLYGREAETARLLGAFNAVAQTGQPRIVLVSGPGGTGKSALVHELRAAMVPVRGVFAAGKCDQFRHDIPYAAFGEAFQRVTQRILGGTEAQQASWRARIQEALGRNARLIIHLVPEVSRLVGEQPPVAQLPPADEERRFQHVFRQFLSVFAQADHPLVLFLDDLQWMDAESLALLRTLPAASLGHMLLIGAYRDDELPPDHPLTHTIRDLRLSGTGVDEIQLMPLGAEDAAQMVADALHMSPDQVGPLSNAIVDKTGGNPFFVGQFMTTLAEEGLISFSHNSSHWHWDLDGILAKEVTDNVAALMAVRIVRLPQQARDVLITLASLGNCVPAGRLARAHGVTLETLRRDAQAAIASGLIIYAANAFSFMHDRIQEAAYGLLPSEFRPARHLQIARRLSHGMSPGEMAEAAFDVVDQFNQGISLIFEQKERDQVALFNLVAGRRARASTAFAAALGYFGTGQRLLGDEGWMRDYRLSFDLALQAAECLFLGGDQADAEQHLLGLAQRARGVVDRAAVSSLLITLYTARDQSDRAVETCLAFLHDLGVDWIAHPGPTAAWSEYRKLSAALANRAVPELLDLPRDRSDETRAVLDVLAATLPPAFFSDQDLVCLILCRMAYLSVANGHCDASPLGYAYLGMVMGPYFGDYEAGFQFGKLGQDLIERYPLPRYEPRVRMCFAYHVAPWTWHICRSIPLIRQAFAIAEEVGDLTYSGFSACTLITSLIAAGAPLSEVQAEAEAKQSFVRHIKFGLITDIIASQLFLLRHLRGLPPVFTSSRDVVLDEAGFEAHLLAEPGLAIAACWHFIRKLQVSVYDSDFNGAVVAARKAEPLLWSTSGHFEMVEYHFHAALALSALEEEGSAGEPSPALLRHQEQLQIWARNCPDNFAARETLVSGAIAAIRGDDLQAMRHFETALRLARTNELIQIQALANEWAARFYLRRDLGTLALSYLRGARDCYIRWGATAKVQQLEQMHSDLLGQEAHATVNLPEAPGAALDLASLLRTSQAVVGEVGLTRLIRTLMTTVLEHAGATRGLLILPKAGGLRIAAEARAERQAVEVELLDTPLAEDNAPTWILSHALQTHEHVLLDDAQQRHGFSDDPNLLAKPTRSVLCLPLLRQGKLTGLLYLENRLAPGAFTAPRLTVLRLLASQAAITLENATLEEKEALLKEMHHRVKNNLQLISSLLNLQASRIADPQVAGLFADSRDRVRSMALVHENLYRAGDYTRVSMRRHISSLCAQLQRTHRTPDQDILVTTEVADLHFDLDKAVSCGLIVNELLSNAFKHAFAGRASGRIHVTLAQPQSGQCHLMVRDDGLGFLSDQPSSPGAADSLGLQLVGDLVDQLRGTAEIESRPGTTFTVTFPFHTGPHPRGS